MEAPIFDPENMRTGTRANIQTLSRHEKSK
jgi:hypothetical protein